jgi:hypothetical protein
MKVTDEKSRIRTQMHTSEVRNRGSGARTEMLRIRDNGFYTTGYYDVERTEIMFYKKKI